MSSRRSFRRVEDIPLGVTYTVLIGPALEVFGSTTSDITASLGASKWSQFFESDYLFSSVTLAKNDDNFNDIYADFTARYYLRWYDYQCVAARFQVCYSESALNQFKLGGTNGLRGYKKDFSNGAAPLAQLSPQGFYSIGVNGQGQEPAMTKKRG